MLSALLLAFMQEVYSTWIFQAGTFKNTGFPFATYIAELIHACFFTKSSLSYPILMFIGGLFPTLVNRYTVKLLEGFALL